MSSLGSRFEQLSARGEKALILFVTAGDPPLDQLLDILDTLQEGGADVIEVGLPFSDPIADGPVIQASSQRALDHGASTRAILDCLRSWKPRAQIPVVLMGYMNPILRAGAEEFASAAAEVGVSGTIISDLTPEEGDEWISTSKLHFLDNIFLAAPTSTDERLDTVCAKSRGFVYAVSRTGVTGKGSSDLGEVETLVNRLRAKTKLPVCVGFGIREPDQVRQVCKIADGAIVGSWLVQFLAEKWNGGQGREELREKVSRLKMATRI